MKVQIPYDPNVFENANEVIIASSFSSQTSDEMLKKQTADDVQEAVTLSGVVDISARKPASPLPQSDSQVVTEIDVKNMEKPIVITIPMTEYDENAKCTYIDSTGKYKELE